MQGGASQPMSSLLHGVDLTGLCLLTALLAISSWACLRPRPAARGERPAAGQAYGFYLLLCAIAAPLLMFASIAAALGMLQKAQPLLAGLAEWKPYRTMLWMLYGVVGLQQLFALHGLGFWPASSARRRMPLASTALVLLPLAMASGLLALERLYLGHAGMPQGLVAAAALASVSGILLWLPAQSIASRTETGRRAEPALAAESRAGSDMKPAADGNGKRLGSAEEMERHMNELSALLEQEQREAEQLSQRKLLQQEQALNESTIQQQVQEQKFLFESGLPCNLGMLVNGLIILDQPLDLRDHVRGDSLLHAVVRDGKHLLAQHLIENGAPPAAVNWAGLTPRACSHDPAMLELLDAAMARIAK
jgi:hypothetical protein